MTIGKNKKLIGVGIVCAAIVIAVSGGILVAALTKNQPAPSVSSITTRKLVFNDEFNGNTLNKSKWNTCYDNYSIQYDGCTNYGNSESEWYTSKGVELKNGNLVLTAKNQPTTGSDKDGLKKTYDYSSGMVSTGRYVPDAPAKWSTSYGYFEARINAPAGKGIWPAFWLLPIDHDWPPEIDIMEILGDKPNQVLNTYHWKGQEGEGVPQDSSTYMSTDNVTGSWHTYAAEWRAGVIDWYIDGKRVKHFENSAVTGKPMQVILNLAVGGTLLGYPDETTPKEAEMLVDYIRVYE